MTISFRIPMTALCMAVGLLAVRCGDQATLVYDECRENHHCASGLCVDGRCLDPADLPPDMQWPVDMGDVQGDAPDSDVQPDGSVEGDPTDSPTDPQIDPQTDRTDGGLLGFGEACTANSQCMGGWCIDFGEDGRICTRECASECEEEGFTCRLITNTGSDATWLCVPERDVLCMPCQYDTDCGGFGNYCVTQDDGRFCATDCTLEGLCPEHYVCNTVIIPDAGPEGEDVTTRLCEPDVHSCSGCYDQDEDGYGVGWGCLGDDCDDQDEDVHPGATELCNYDDDDCDGIDDNGFDLDSSLDHCGACNTPCHPDQHELTQCADGDCIRTCEQDYYNIEPLVAGCEYYCILNSDTGGTEVCNFIDDDCDSVPDDGFDLQNDPAVCGDCTPCDLPNSSTHECVRGECRPLVCDPGWSHCDEDFANGCEQDIWHDIANCGACDEQCEFDNAVPLCGTTGCYFTECSSTNYANCNSIQGDGCEVDLRSDALNCGACLQDCHLVFPHAEVTCASRSCQMGDCLAYYYDLSSSVPGCEYGPCYGDPATVDLPDSSFVDADCDGIDGDITRAVFVTPSGSDRSTTCSMTAPCATIARALTVAVSRSATQVLVQAGTYAAIVDLGSTHNGIGIYGGYNSTWARGDRGAVGFETIITGGQHPADGEYMVVRARSVTGATLANLQITAPNASGRVNNNGRSSYGVHAVSSTLTVENVTIRQGNGVPGLAGSNGSAYSTSPAPTGGAGGDNHEGFSLCDDSVGGAGGAGPANCSSASAAGGGGGDGGRKDKDCSCSWYDPWNCNWDATSGWPGGQGGSGVGGSGGVRGTTCSDGGNGGGGSNGTNGSGGYGGSGGGLLYSANGFQFWTARDGNAGWLGSHGTGGGGGGGGGAGGCRAPSAGQAGNGGGGSFGVFAVSSTVTVRNSQFLRGTAGAGGAGGAGGRGQTGGAAGAGGGGQGEGHGGNGGSGGRGGHSGGAGGGAGGNSHGIYTSGCTVTQSGSTYTSGSAGAGGAGGSSDGSSGTAGATGQLGTVGVFTP